MYTTILAAHNILRWVALIFIALAFVGALFGYIQKRSWKSSDRLLGLLAGIALDVQLVMGLILYLVLSPLTTSSFANLAGAMASDDRRFFVVEHLLLMVLAVVFAHLGSLMSKKAGSDLRKFQRATIWFGLALVLILAGIPWFRPFFPGL